MFDLTEDDFFTGVKHDLEMLDDPASLIKSKLTHNTFNMSWNEDGELEITHTHKLPWEFALSNIEPIAECYHSPWDFDVSSSPKYRLYSMSDRWSTTTINNMVNMCTCDGHIFPWSFDTNKCDKCAGLISITDPYLIYLNSLNTRINITNYYIDPWIYLSKAYLMGGNLDEIVPEHYKEDKPIIVPPWIDGRTEIRMYEDEVKIIRGTDHINNITEFVSLNTTVANVHATSINIDAVSTESLWVNSEISTWNFNTTLRNITEE